MLVAHGSPVVETRNWKCWFPTVLLLSKHQMLVAVKFLWFQFLTFHGSLLQLGNQHSPIPALSFF
jgi:hypothetical protein